MPDTPFSTPTPSTAAAARQSLTTALGDELSFDARPTLALLRIHPGGSQDGRLALAGEALWIWPACGASFFASYGPGPLDGLLPFNQASIDEMRSDADYWGSGGASARKVNGHYLFEEQLVRILRSLGPTRPPMRIVVHEWDARVILADAAALALIPGDQVVLAESPSQASTPELRDASYERARSARVVAGSWAIPMCSDDAVGALALAESRALFSCIGDANSTQRQPAPRL